MKSFDIKSGDGGNGTGVISCAYVRKAQTKKDTGIFFRLHRELKDEWDEMIRSRNMKPGDATDSTAASLGCRP